MWGNWEHIENLMGTHCEQPQNKLSIVPKPQKKRKQGGVSHCGLAIYSKKYLKAKEELWKLKYFTMQKCNLQKNPLKETKILQNITTL
jgi:hypothetical protein